jgi:hypothetical protein
VLVPPAPEKPVKPVRTARKPALPKASTPSADPFGALK